MARQTTVLAMMAAGLLIVSAAAPARAADDPSGDWKWIFSRNGQDIEILMTLKVDGEKVTGTVGRAERKADIQDGTFKNGELAFKVVRERDGQSFTQTYKGKLEGDAIKGTIEFEFGGESRTRDWEATRVK
jgi:hypothetical protein